MSQLIKKLQSQKEKHHLTNFFSLIERELIDVKRVINSELLSYDDDLVSDIIESIPLEGKMIRPSLFMYCFYINSGGKIDEDRYRNMIKMAASIELFHLFSLIHDDVIDDSTVRRNKKALQFIYGKNCAIVAGDLIFVSAMNLLVDCNNEKAKKIIVKNAEGVVKGELRQIVKRGVFNITFDEYIEIIGQKTGGLFSASCCSGASFFIDDINIYSDIGKNLGVFFQIKNDVSEYTNQKDSNDLKNREITLPVIIARDNLESDNERKKLANDFEMGNNKKLVDILHKTDSINESLKISNSYLDKVKEKISTLPENKYRDSFLKLVDSI